MIEPPPLKTIEKSMSSLEKIKAIKKIEEGIESIDNYELTPLGYHIASLPVSPKIGKIMIYSCIFRCVDPLLTICASMSFKSPFIHQRNSDEISSKTQFSEKFSDHLTLLNAFQQFEESYSQKNSNSYSFCQKNNLSFNTMNEIYKLKRLFHSLLQDIHFIDRSSSFENKTDKYNQNSQNKKLIKSIICAGLYPSNNFYLFILFYFILFYLFFLLLLFFFFFYFPFFF